MGVLFRVAGILVVTFLCGLLHPTEGHGHKHDITNFEIGSSESAHQIPRPDHTSSSANVQDDLTSEDVLHLCHAQGHHYAGSEGLAPQGMTLDKTYILVVGARGLHRHSPLDGFPHPPVDCRFSHHAAKSASSSSLKVQTFHTLAQDFTQLGGKSKSGLHNAFPAVPSSRDCGSFHAAPFALSKMIHLGEFLARSYGPILPSLRDPGDAAAASADCIPEQDYFQSTAALLHGLLPEKQFVRANIGKLDRRSVRGLGSHNWCEDISEVGGFLERAFIHEHEVFLQRDLGTGQRERLYRRLGIGGGDRRPGKDILESLSRWYCHAESVPCSQDNGMGCVRVREVNVSGVEEVVSRHNAYLSANPVFQAYARADTRSHLRRHLLAWFLQGEGHRNHGNQKVKVNVVDDFFFLKVLAAVGHRARHVIAPGSRLVVEQYIKRRSKGGGAKFWRVLVDGKVVTETLGSCAGGAGAKGVCGVDTITAQWDDWENGAMFGVCSDPQVRDEL